MRNGKMSYAYTVLYEEQSAMQFVSILAVVRSSITLYENVYIF